MKKFFILIVALVLIGSGFIVRLGHRPVFAASFTRSGDFQIIVHRDNIKGAIVPQTISVDVYADFQPAPIYTGSVLFEEGVPTIEITIPIFADVPDDEWMTFKCWFTSTINGVDPDTGEPKVLTSQSNEVSHKVFGRTTIPVQPGICGQIIRWDAE